MAGPTKLTPKQARFVQEYLIDLNAAQAAIRAGYSAKTARVIGHENLTKPDIAAAIEKAQAERAERAEVTADWVIDELRKIACANMADYMKSTPEGGIVLDFAESKPRGTRSDRRGFRSARRRRARHDASRSSCTTSAPPWSISAATSAFFEMKRKQQDMITIEVDFEDVRDKIFRTLARLSAARRSKSGGQIPEPRRNYRGGRVAGSIGSRGTSSYRRRVTGGLGSTSPVAVPARPAAEPNGSMSRSQPGGGESRWSPRRRPMPATSWSKARAAFWRFLRPGASDL